MHKDIYLIDNLGLKSKKIKEGVGDRGPGTGQGLLEGICFLGLIVKIQDPISLASTLQLLPCSLR